MHLPIPALLAAAAALSLLDPAAAAAAEQLIRNVGIVDVEAGTVTPAQDILLRDGVIAATGDTPLTAAGATVLDGAGGYVIPGLWDSHVHVFSSTAEPATAFPLYLLNGVTGIRDMGGLLPFEAMQRIQAAVAAGEMAGPRLVLSGAWVDAAPGSWPGMFLADTPAQARAVVQQVDAQGWAAVKAYSMLAEETYLALGAEAEAVGLPLVGHIPEAVTLPTAMAAGHDVIEHFGRVTKACSREETAMIAGVRAALAADDPRTAMITEMTGHNRIVLESWDEALCERVLAALVAAEVSVVPSLVVADFYTGQRPADLAERLALLPKVVREGWMLPDFRLEAMTEELRALAEDTIALDRRTFAMAHAAGVGILAGTDASFANPYIFHGHSLLDELDRYVAAGLTPREALVTATLAPARVLGFGDESGRIAAGMRADLVVLSGNPLEDLAVLRAPVAVVANGRVFDSDALAAMRQQLLAAD